MLIYLRADFPVSSLPLLHAANFNFNFVVVVENITEKGGFAIGGTSVSDYSEKPLTNLRYSV